MKRLAVVVLGAMLVAQPVSAQTDDADTEQMVAFASIVGEGSQVISDTLPGILTSADARATMRAELGRQRTALLAVDPGLCWLRTYVSYLESLVLIDAAIAIIEADPGAVTPLLRMANSKTFDAAELYACSGMTPP